MSLPSADLKLVLRLAFKKIRMKKIILFASIASLFVSCKEQVPVGLVIDNSTLTKDTTYLSAPETPDPKSVLIEESTGNKCANCPTGKAQIDQMVAANPGRIKVMALHYKGLEIDLPAEKYYSLENQDVRDLISYLDGDQGQPCAAFDRVKDASNKYFIVRGSGGNWSGALSTELSKPSTVNIHMTSAYEATGNVVTVNTTLAFTDTTSSKLYLSLFVVEDGLIGTQDSSVFPSGVVKIEDYEFNEVLRKAISPVIGSPLLSSMALIEKGRVFRRTIMFQPDAAWNKDNCHIIAVVHKSEAENKSVVQVEQVHMK
jgi:hypothetical protein